MLPKFLIRVLTALTYACAGALLVGIALLVGYVGAGPQLAWWHTIELRDEFTADSSSRIRSVADYRALEDRLFASLERESAAARVTEPGPYARYSPGSKSDPVHWPDGNWNRTQELIPPHPRGAALLLHGVSDSPYSLRALALTLYDSNIAVVVLRLPGHGTAPSALLSYRLEDMRAAVRIAAGDLSARVGKDKPLWLVGYSNGAALSVDYALDVAAGAALPRPAGLVLLSPAIGIAPAAQVVRLRHLFGWVPGLGKLGWTEISPEYDPFKYSSFTFNAIEQTSRLARSIQTRTARPGALTGFPPTLAFLSAVDATVSADAVVDQFMGRLTPGGHALVLFDVNRSTEASHMLRGDPGPLTRRLLSGNVLPFDLAIVANIPGDPDGTAALIRMPDGAQAEVPLCLHWPPGVFSLSHLALPFRPDDRLYGYSAPMEDSIVQLGRLEARGETGVLALPRWLTTRQRSNPFFSYLEQRVLEFVGDPRPRTTSCPESDLSTKPMIR